MGTSSNEVTEGSLNPLLHSSAAISFAKVFAISSTTMISIRLFILDGAVSELVDRKRLGSNLLPV